MQDSELKCTYANHQQKKIQGICVNKQCEKLRPVCFNCTKDSHYSHLNELIDFDQFKIWRQEGVAVYQQVKILVLELESVTHLLREQIRMNCIDESFNLFSSTTDAINKEVRNVLNIKSFTSLVSNDLQKLNEYLQIIKKKCKEFNPSKDSINQLQFFQIKLPQRPIVNQQQLHFKPILVENVVKKNSFKFSQLYKHEWVKVSEQGNLAEESGFCVCDPVIPNIGVTKVGFKIIKGQGWMGIGVCQRDIIKYSNYNPDINNIGHGCYLIGYDGNSYSHNQQEINNKLSSFQFFTNDIIIVEVDNQNKKISWIKNKSNKRFVTIVILTRQCNLISIEIQVIVLDQMVAKWKFWKF